MWFLGVHTGPARESGILPTEAFPQTYLMLGFVLFLSYYVDKATFKLIRVLPATSSQVLELKACTTILSHIYENFETRCHVSQNSPHRVVKDDLKFWSSFLASSSQVAHVTSVHLHTEFHEGLNSGHQGWLQPSLIPSHWS